MKSYYEILELANYAEIAEIKKAFKRLALLYHPDKNPNNKEAEELFKEINEAYQVLSNEFTRAKYNQLLDLGYHHSQLKNNFFEKEKEAQNKEDERYAAKQAAWREHIRRKNEKTPYDVSNTQAAFFSILVIAYLLSFVTNLVDINARLYYLSAMEAVEKKQYKKALDDLDRTMTMDRKFTKGYALAAKIELEQFKHYLTAAEKYTHAIEFTPILHTEYYYQRGLAFCHLRATKNAKRDFDLLLQTYPDSTALTTKIAYHYYHILQNDTISEQLFTKIIQKTPKNPTIYVDLGDITMRKQNFNKALNYYTTAISNGNTTAKAYQRRSICYLDLQKTSEACKDWTKAKTLDSSLKNETLDFFCNNNVVE